MKKSKEFILTSAMFIVITYTLALSLVSQVFPAGQTSSTLSSTGSIQIQTTVGIGVYSNPECTNPRTSMAWGTLVPGGSQNIICYIKNEGSSPSTLSMYPSGWDPASLATSNYLVLSWDYDGHSINPDDAIPVTFTLTVDASIEGITSFSFDITIVGSS